MNENMKWQRMQADGNVDLSQMVQGQRGRIRGKVVSQGVAFCFRTQNKLLFFIILDVYHKNTS